jgi:serine protease inhibitor
MKNQFLSFFLALSTLLSADPEFASIHRPMQTAHQQFSLSLFHHSFQDQKNVHICPLAIETLLKTLSLGSYKVTAYDLQTALKNPLIPDQLFDFHLETLQNLETALDKGEYIQKSALYVSNGLTVDPQFLAKAQKFGSIDILQEDLKFSCGQKIQEWLNLRFKKNGFKFSDLGYKETKGKISFISVVNYQLQWRYPFDSMITSIDSFQYSNLETQGIVDMMEQVIESDYFEDDLMQAVALPLENHLTCLIFLPKKDSLKKLIDSLEKPIYLKKIVSKMKQHAVHIKFPKIHLDNPTFYKDALLKMGLSQPFSKIADFRGIDSKHAICLDTPIQVCRIHFNEGGINTEMPGKVKRNIPLKTDYTVHMNHPFIFLIMDPRSFTILDAGCYQSPY